MEQSDAAEAAEAAVRQAEVEGLVLTPSDNKTGYHGVYMGSSGKAKPFYAAVWRDSARVYLGWFSTAEEAALTYARSPEARGQSTEPASLTPRSGGTGGGGSG